ncbi:MAG TPA: hypothetical protein VEA39_02620 [Methylophilaceae bacterium]|nr:hypothetical protein [Methylophilaceae bacterium]
MPAGADSKREREYKELERKFKKEGRYHGREEEVAARIVNKQRSEYGETQEEKRKDKEGRSPDRNLPIKNYQKLTISEIDKKLNQLFPQELRKIRAYEASHKNRKSLLAKIDNRLTRH